MLTVFTSAVYPDLARLWYECVTRAFPAATTSFEIFDDSENTLDAAAFPRATILRQSPSRRDFQESYNDAVQRARTPYLAFIDTDIFWTSRDLWTHIAPQLSRPGLAAISCISRRHRPSHGTFALVCNVAVYREIMERVPGGFFPLNTRFGPDVPITEWTGFDTGDVITLAVKESGYQVELHHLDDEGAFVCFESVTMYRRTAERVGCQSGPMRAMVNNSNWLWRGCIGSMVLERVHNRLFPGTPSHAHTPWSASAIIRAMGSQWPQGLRFTGSCMRSAWRVRRFLKSEPAPNIFLIS